LFLRWKILRRRAAILIWGGSGIVVEDPISLRYDKKKKSILLNSEILKESK
jgi:hypothetical protein